MIVKKACELIPGDQLVVRVPGVALMTLEAVAATIRNAVSVEIRTVTGRELYVHPEMVVLLLEGGHGEA